MWRRTSGRWRQAMAVLAVVERRSSVLPASTRWRRFVTSGPRAQAAEPAAAADVDRPGDGTAPITAPVAADSVVIGKFDRGRQVRMRAFYPAAGLSARVQAGSRDGRTHGVGRSVRAAQLVGEHRPGLLPAMVDHGTLFRNRTAYLVEHVVDGRPPTGPAEVADAMAVVAAELGVVQRAVGVTTARLSAVVPPTFRQRWRGVVDDGHVSPRLAARVDRLIDRDDRLEVSFTHGDLVSSNVLRTGGGVVLIDWEYADFRPIAFDLAKMHINAGPAGPALDRLAEVLDGLVGHGAGHYSLLEQLTLAHVVVLSRLEARMHKARAARRLEPLRRQTHKRAQAVHHLISLQP